MKKKRKHVPCEHEPPQKKRKIDLFEEAAKDRDIEDKRLLNYNYTWTKSMTLTRLGDCELFMQMFEEIVLECQNSRIKNYYLKKDLVEGFKLNQLYVVVSEGSNTNIPGDYWTEFGWDHDGPAYVHVFPMIVRFDPLSNGNCFWVKKELKVLKLVEAVMKKLNIKRIKIVDKKGEELLKAIGFQTKQCKFNARHKCIRDMFLPDKK